MRALLATTGSEGDVRPFFALARELSARGHDVLLAAPDHYAPSAAERGVRFRKFGPPWDLAGVTKIFERVLAESNPLSQLKIVMNMLAEGERLGVPELLDMVGQADVVVYPPLLVAAAAAARARGVRHVSVQFAPVHPARGYAPNGSNLGSFLNGALWSLASRMLARATDPQLNAIVQAAGLPPRRSVLVDAASSLLDLIAISPRVWPKDAAWPASSRVTGYWFVDEPDFVPDPALAAFVEEGERPVVVGFGSMIGFDATARTRTLLEAARYLGRKVVVQTGWAGLGGADLPANVRVTKFVPHGWLFPRAACVVHHGGAGTTAAAFRAGIPQAIVWHLADQPGWAKKAQSLGVSPGAVFHEKLSAPWLRAQIERMCTDEAMQKAARTLGEDIRKENGVEVAASAIEGVVARGASN